MLGKRYKKLNNFGVKVKSVDGFQGGEEDIIIISTVRSNNAGAVGFISNSQRTNVALTRARHCLWVLGNERTLTGSKSLWKRIIFNAKERHCFFNAAEDKSLTEAIIDIKEHLRQLDDLLNKDSILFKSARWKVLFSDNFVKSFSKLPSIRAKKSVMSLLVNLSNGWRPKKIKVDPVCESTVQIVKQYKVEGRYVICTNDIMKESRYIQVMKIWDIVPLEDVSKLVKRLDNIYGAFTDDFLSRCKEKSLEGELEIPTTWSTSIEIVRYKSNYTESTSSSDGDMDGMNYAENARVSESFLLMKFYSLSAGVVGHLLSDSDGRALDLPFEVTDEERQIILHPKSSFILGRSGTGKTTVLTMKLFQKEQLHHMAQEGLDEVNSHASIRDVTHSEVSGENGNVLRQLFVTVSPKLCYAIKQHVSHLKSFARNERSSRASVRFDADDIYDRDQFTDVPDSFVAVPPNSYPLVITFSKFLLMLDGTLGTSYFERFHDEMVFSYGGSTGRSAALLLNKKEVNYDKFSMCYWPHFNSQLTKKLDASRVFTEIISSIKGGIHVGETEGGKLCLEGYLNLSEGRTSTLSRQDREMIYDIFMDYEKMKAKKREFDLADLVNDLHRRLKHERYRGDDIDFVYIDEVQDLTMRQIALFKYICRNVDEGFVFSGDTAQTIARGIDFRFEDVRCLFYKEFVVSKENDGASENLGKRNISPIFCLSQNFRTHAGILKLGQSVIQLIYHFFPHSIDILPPETSLIFGEAPILLESGTDENAIVTIFGNTGNTGGNLVGFGAEQVILVRDDCVRKEISSYVGKHALVLTIVECKGLEFEDVLLYNFFGSSPLKNQWRVVYEYMKMRNLLDLPQHFPNFNSGKHNILCSELKQLYVAVTRTRQRLWICENKEDLSQPMFDYWKKLCVVQVRRLDDSLARAMQVASSPEEWKARGKKFLEVKNYEMATMCFERAGDRHWEIFAKAAGLKASADRTRHLNPKVASSIHRQAAELFESINEYQRAADCFYELKEFGRAGKIYYEHCGEIYIKRAGECFILAGHYKRAAEVYAKCKLYSDCLSSCTKGRLFDMGLQYIQFWKHQGMGSDLDKIEQVFLENCARSQYEQDDKRGMIKFVKAFSSEDSMRRFLKKLGCLDELLILEEELGNFSKAAEVAGERGDFILEADLLQKGGFFKEACALFLWYAFASCLWSDGRKGWPLQQCPQMEELILKAKASAYIIKPHDLYKTVCMEALILFNINYSLSELKQLLTISQSHKNLRGEILLTRKILDSLLHIDASKYDWESDVIEDLAVHSVQKISKNGVSVETMVYFWKSWKETILAIFKYLEGVEAKKTSDFAEHGEFCLNYLGIRNLFLNARTLYVCLYPDAEWLREVNKSFFRKFGNRKFGRLVSIDMQHLFAAARNHWSAELLSTGMKVLDILEALQKNVGKSPCPVFSKTSILLHVYEVAQSLSSLKSSKQMCQGSKSLQRHIDLSTEEYFGYVFPLDWRKAVHKEFIHVRGKEISGKIFEEIILKNIPMTEKLTYGQLGRVAMMLLGSHKGKIDLHETFMRKLDKGSPWKPLFEVLSGYAESGPSNRTANNRITGPQGRLKESLAWRLRGALRDAYVVNWRGERDYISPSCFLYLVDRLMVSLVEFQGYLMITRSSLVEWFIHLEWKANLSPNLQSGGDKSVFLRDTHDLLALILQQLLMNKHETVQWVKSVGINAKHNFPVLLLRLVVLMCLLHLNSRSYQMELQQVLNWTEITKQLPQTFCDALWRMDKVGVETAVAEALNAINDPLVIMTIGEIRLKVPTAAISLDNFKQSKEDLLRILFRDKVKACKDTASCSATFPQKMNEGCVEFQDGNVWKVFDGLKLILNENNRSRQSFMSNAPKIKVQIDKIHDLMTRVMTMASESNTCVDENKNFLAEADCMLLELRLLSAALDTSEKQLKDSMLLIEDGARKLLSGKPIFEHFLNPLFPQKDATAPLENYDVGNFTDGEDNEEAADDSNNLEDGQKYNPSAAFGKQNTSQGGDKNKGKPNKKPKRSKKDKGNLKKSEPNRTGPK